jgi:hypothetical protein
MRPQAAADQSPVAAADAPSFYLAASRPFLENHIRTGVRVLPNLRFLDRCDVVGLATTPDGRRVTGVRVRLGSVPGVLRARPCPRRSPVVASSTGKPSGQLRQSGCAGRSPLTRPIELAAIPTGDRDHHLALDVMWVSAPAGWVVAAGSAAAGHDEPG